MSFEMPAESPTPLPPVFDAANVEYSYPFAWGSWNVTHEANDAYGLVPAVGPRDPSTFEPDGYMPLRIALIGPDEAAALPSLLQDQEDDPRRTVIHATVSNDLEHPWIAIDLNPRLDFTHAYMDALVTGQSKAELEAAYGEGEFPIEQFVIHAATALTMRVAKEEFRQTYPAAAQQNMRGIKQVFLGGTAVIADVAADWMVIPDMPYITVPAGVAACLFTGRGIHKANVGTAGMRQAATKLDNMRAVAPYRSMAAARDIHNIYAPEREE